MITLSATQKNAFIEIRNQTGLTFDSFTILYKKVLNNEEINENEWLKHIKSVALVFGNIVSDRIKALEIPNEQDRFKIAKAASASRSYIKNIAEFHLNPDHRLRLYKIILRYQPDFITHYKNEMTPTQFYKVLKIIAKHNFPKAYLKHISALSQKQRFNLAKLTIGHPSIGWCPVCNKRNEFDLTSNQWYKLAKIGAQRAFQFYYPQDFKFTDSQRLKIGKILAVSGARGLKQKTTELALTQSQKYQVMKVAAKFQPDDCGGSEFDFNQKQKQKIKLIEELHTTRNYFLNDRIKARKLESKLDELQKIIPNFKNEDLKSKAINALKSFVIADELHNNKAFLQQHPKLLSSLFQSRDATVYRPVIESIFQIKPKHFEKLAGLHPEKLMALMPLLTIDESFFDIALKSDLRDLQLRNPFIRLLDSLKKDAYLMRKKQIKILQWVLEDPKNKDQVILRCRIINAINILGNESLHYSKLGYEEILQKQFSKIIPKFKCDLKTLFDILFSTRNPFAIFTYAASLSKLQDSEKKVAINHLITFLQSLVKGDFKQMRQDPNKNRHLKFLKDKAPETLEQFHQGFTTRMNPNHLSENSEPIHHTIKQIITNAFNDSHITDKSLVGINLTGIPENELNFSFPPELLHEHLKNLTNGQSERIKNDELYKSRIIYLRLQMQLIRLTQPDVTEAIYKECLHAFEKVLDTNSQFLKDLQSIQKLFQAKATIQDEIILNDTDDPFEILLCGTEVEGSCQRIDGNPEYNKGLLGYLLNGQTRLLTLKIDGCNSIKARAIIRLLIDKKEKPVLLMERIYPEILQPELKEALMTLAKTKADKLNLPLLKKGGGKPYKTTIINHGVHAPEYVDSMHGINTKYCIKKIFQIM